VKINRLDQEKHWEPKKIWGMVVNEWECNEWEVSPKWNFRTQL
jgi:hypothetical protein